MVDHTRYGCKVYIKVLAMTQDLGFNPAFDLPAMVRRMRISTGTIDSVGPNPENCSCVAINRDVGM